MRKKKGFTLIELLAVIVILAIIALIAVPVILNIIDKANKSAFKDTAYGIISAGELYFAEQQLEVNGMQEEKTFTLPDTTNTLGLKGNIPTGTMTITRDGNISLMIKNDRYCVTKGYNDQDITITEDVENCKAPIEEDTGGNQGTDGSTSNTLATLATTSTEVTSVPACVTDGSECAVGTPVAIQVNESEVYNFYVLSETNNEVTLIMDRNLGDNVAWYEDAEDNTHGPTTALNALNKRTSGWTNIPETTYTVSGLGISSDGNTKTQLYEDMAVTGRARMLTYEEATDASIGCTTNMGSCPEWLSKNLIDTGDSSQDSNGNYKYGYWITTPHTGITRTAWRVFSTGNVFNGVVSYADNGLRPVISLSKSAIQ